MAVDVSKLLDNVDIVAVAGHYTALEKLGTEFAGLCPFHNESTPSFTVSPQKQFAHCFGCGWNGDAIDIVKEVEGISWKDACAQLGSSEWKAQFTTHQRVASHKAVDRVTCRPPDDVDPPDFYNAKLGGDPVLVLPICDLDGRILGYECRYEVAGKKQPRIWSWGKRGTQAAQWGMGHFTSPRPLYGLEGLLVRPDAPIGLCEGPKKAKAARELLPMYVWLSWTGGANSWHKHNFDLLRGRPGALVWPDNDEPGKEAGFRVARMISDRNGLGIVTKVIDPQGQPDGWDAADALAEGWSQFKTKEWAKPRIIVFDAEQAPAPEAPEPKPVPAEMPPAPEPEKITPPPKPKKPKLEVVGNTALKPEPEPEEDIPPQLSDDHIAEEWAKMHGEDWKFVPKWNKWFYWDGNGWVEDETNRADREFVQICRQASRWDASRYLTEEGRRQVASARKSGNIRTLVKSDQRVTCRSDQWDSNNFLLGTPAGVIDLVTGECRPAARGDFITMRTAVSPEEGTPEKWLRFLESVQPDPEMRAYLQRFAGYCLTGDVREQCLAFLYGTGQNGKGVFLTAISAVMGDYAAPVEADLLMHSEGNRHTQELAVLRGKRLAVIDETDGSKRFNEERLKRLTGGSKITAHLMHGNNFEFMPTFKFLIAGNHKPQVRGVGKSIQRRMQMVPFAVSVRDEDRNDKLGEELALEYPRILNWMIQGCLLWQQKRLSVPETVKQATANYLVSEDVLGEFVEDCTVLSGRCAKNALYRAYKLWADEKGDKVWTSRAFFAAMDERGFSEDRATVGRFINGISLRSSLSSDPRDMPWPED